MDTTQVGFTVHGDFITDHFRSLVREGDWRKALEDTNGGLIGMTSEYAEMILSGKATLEGVNTVKFVGDDKHEDPKWVKAHYYTYTRGLFLYKGDIYKKYRVIPSLCEDDAEKAMAMFEWTTIPIGQKDVIEQFNYDRLRTYMDNMSDDIALYKPSEGWTLCRKETPDYPSWLLRSDFKTLIQTNTFDDIESLEQASHEVSFEDRAVRRLYQDDTDESSTEDDVLIQYAMDMAVADNALDNLDELRAKVKAKADEKGGWLTITDKMAKKSYTIPKNAFLRWSLSDSPMYQKIDWSAVSPQGMKMGGDDPNHTDWWLFTGLPMEASLDHNSRANSVFFKERHRVHEEMTGSNIKCLINSHHKGLRNAFVIRIDDPKSNTFIPKDAIVIIPNASPDFEMIAKKAADNNCIIITQTGGALCHLATVGREFSLQLYLLPDAGRVFCGAIIATISTSNHQLSIPDYQDTEFEMLLGRKMSGSHYR